MTPFVQDADFTLYVGDALAVLSELPDASVDCAATSPPFFGLRDYGTGSWEGGDEGCDHQPPPREARKFTNGRGEGSDDKYAGSNFTSWTYRDATAKDGGCPKGCGARRVDQQIGLEATPEQWAARLVQVFRELRRVLVPAGTLWVECGDSYAQTSGRVDAQEILRDKRRLLTPEEREKRGNARNPYARGIGRRDRTANSANADIKPKDLIGAPFLLAMALRADGWWWRSTNIWHKPNCLPESATDRPTVAHSYVFQFSKAARYFHNAEAVREPAEYGRREWNYDVYGVLADGRGRAPTRATGTVRGSDSAAGRNLRSVWTIPTQGFPEAHFATWPEALVERILLMACPESVCRVCGKAREPIVERVDQGWDGSKYGERAVEATGGAMSGGTAKSTLGSANGKLTGKTNVVGLSECGCLLPEAARTHPQAGTSQGVGAGVGDASVAPRITPASDSKYRPGIILDPFMGSGTTALVARRHGRHSVGIELNEQYARDYIVKRTSQLSLLAEA